MQRRKFLQNGLGAALSTVALGSMAKGESRTEKSFTNNSTGEIFKMKYAPHDGMFKNSAGGNIVDQLKFMHDQGFRAFEDNGLPGRSESEQKKIGDTLAKLDMTMGVFVVDKGGNGANTLTAGKQEYIDIFLKGCKQAVEVAKRVQAKWATVVPGDFFRDLPIDMQTAHVIDALRKGVEILEPHGLIMVLESLSDTPDLFLRTVSQNYMICRAVNSPSCKILYDMYHIQRNEGNLIKNFELCWSEIGYLQIGNNPGRNEPGTGEVDYKNIFKYLHEKGYQGVLGMEHGNSKPGKEGELSLIKAYRDADNF